MSEFQILLFWTLCVWIDWVTCDRLSFVPYTAFRSWICKQKLSPLSMETRALKPNQKLQLTHQIHLFPHRFTYSILWMLSKCGWKSSDINLNPLKTRKCHVKDDYHTKITSPYIILEYEKFMICLTLINGIKLCTYIPNPIFYIFNSFWQSKSLTQLRFEILL